MKLGSIVLSSVLAASALSASSTSVDASKAPQPHVSLAKAPGAISGTATLTTKATVQKIDKKTRVITLKKETGEIVDFTATEDVRNFAQIKVGDIVTTKLSNTLDIRLVKGASGEVGHAIQETSSRAKPGEKPQGTAARTMAARAKVTKLDPKTHVMTLEGQNGASEVVVKDPEQFKLIAVGDMIDVVTTDTIAISVTTPTKK
jgi:hypothetical protein